MDQRSRAALKVAEQIVAARATVASLEAKFQALVAPEHDPTCSEPCCAEPRAPAPAPSSAAVSSSWSVGGPGPGAHRLVKREKPAKSNRAASPVAVLSKRALRMQIARISAEIDAIMRSTPRAAPVPSAPAPAKPAKTTKTTKTGPAAPPAPVPMSGFTAVLHAEACLGRLPRTGRITAEQVLDLHRSIEIIEIEAWRIALEVPASAHATRRAIARRADELAADDSKPTELQLGAALREVRFDLRDSVPVALRAIDLDLDAMRAVLAELELEASQYPVTEHVRRMHDVASRMRARFVAANMGLVHSVACKYTWSGTPLADLMQEGTLGLMHAIPRFDRDKGFKFSTYATNWIRHEIGRHLENCGENVRIPVHARSTLRKLARAKTAFRTQHGRDPSHVELGGQAKIDVAVVRKLGECIVGEARMTAEGTERVFAKVTDDSASAMDVLIANQDASRLRAAIAKLPEREREVIERRFGLDDASDGKTHAEIGERYDLSRERIRQIEVKSLKLLRALLAEDE